MYKLNPKILQTSVTDDSILLLEPSQGLYFEVDGVSAFIYQCIIDGLDCDEMSIRVAKKYDVIRSVALNDILYFIDQLQQSNIIEK